MIDYNIKKNLNKHIINMVKLMKDWLDAKTDEDFNDLEREELIDEWKYILKLTLSIQNSLGK